MEHPEVLLESAPSSMDAVLFNLHPRPGRDGQPVQHHLAFLLPRAIRI